MATNWSSRTVVDLRAELKKRGMATAGKKADLVERLTTAEAETEVEQTEVEQTEVEQTEVEQTEVEQTEVEQTEVEQTEVEQTEVEQTEVAQGDDAGVLNTDNQSAPPAEAPALESRAESPQETDKKYPSPAPAATPAQEGRDTDVSAQPPTMETSADAPELSPELSKDARGRKRRSRSPPPSDDESSHKRARAGEQGNAGDIDALDGATLALEEVIPLSDDLTGKDTSFATIVPEIPAESRQEYEDVTMKGNEDHESKEELVNVEKETSPALRDQGCMPIDDDIRPTYQSDLDMDEDYGDVEPSLHAATTALYIKNFMRPLKEPTVLDYIVEAASPPGKTPDERVVEKFYLDGIRTHAFINFTSVAAASRVRVKLHGKVWPDERNRKPLWVDFIPPEKIEDWIQKEKADEAAEKEKRAAGLAKIKIFRWEVRYDEDNEGRVSAELIDAADPQYARQPTASHFPSAVPIPTGPARQFSGIEGAPLGPRGRGNFRDFRSAGDGKFTEAGPSLVYKPVSDELAQRRLANMRSFYTTDRHRYMGRPNEINRYTFENEDSFVDRGIEVFIGIRPPRREIERRRGGGNGGGNRRRRGPPPFGPRGGDRYIGGRNDGPRRDAPRSRIDGAPLPTYGAGSGFRSDRSGPRWDTYRGGR